MRAGLAFTCGLVALWLALFGVVALVFGIGVVEVLVLEVAGVVLAVLSVGLLLADTRCGGCGCDPDCQDVR